MASNDLEQYAVVAQRDAVIAGRLIKVMPQVPLERLGDDLRPQREGAWHARNKAELCKGGRRVLGVPLRIGDQIPRRWGTCTGSHEGFSLP